MNGRLRAGRVLRPGAPVIAWALVLCACGAARAAPARCASRPAPTAPEAAIQGVAAMADRATVAPGQTVTFTVVAQGPARYAAPCTAPLQLVVDDATELSVFSAASSPGPASACGSLALGSGQREVYSVAWPVDPTLPRGRYYASLVLGDGPPLRLPISVAAAPGAC